MNHSRARKMIYAKMFARAPGEYSVSSSHPSAAPDSERWAPGCRREMSTAAAELKACKRREEAMRGAMEQAHREAAKKLAAALQEAEVSAITCWPLGAADLLFLLRYQYEVSCVTYQRCVMAIV